MERPVLPGLWLQSVSLGVSWWMMAVAGRDEDIASEHGIEPEIALGSLAFHLLCPTGGRSGKISRGLRGFRSKKSYRSCFQSAQSAASLVSVGQSPCARAIGSAVAPRSPDVSDDAAGPSAALSISMVHNAQ